MDRRAFLGTLAGGLLAAPFAAEAPQPGKVWRIGYLSPAEGHNNAIDEAFDRSMKELGYVEGQALRVERRYTGGRTDRLAGAAAELVGLNVDAIVAWSPTATYADHTHREPAGRAGVALCHEADEPSDDVADSDDHKEARRILLTTASALMRDQGFAAPPGNPPGWTVPGESAQRPRLVGPAGRAPFRGYSVPRHTPG